MNDELNLETEDEQEQVFTKDDYHALQADLYPDAGPYPDLEAAQHVAYSLVGIKTVYATVLGFYIRDWRHLGTMPEDIQFVGRYAFGRWVNAIAPQD